MIRIKSVLNAHQVKIFVYGRVGKIIPFPDSVVEVAWKRTNGKC